MGLILPVGASAPQQDTGHWYDRSGNPCYQQRTKKGGLRSTDLRDGRKLGLVPSVTTVTAILPKPQLEKWKRRQAIMAALTLTRGINESDEDFIARVEADSQQQAKAAAEEGTRIHDACECAMQGRAFPAAYVLHVAAVKDELAQLFPSVDDWLAEASFAHPMGYGGKVDLHSPSTGIVVDYKGKDGDFSDGKKLAYDQHYQLAAYQVGLELPRNVCANIFVSRTHPGKVASHVWKEKDVEEGWRVFESALETWKRLRKFDSAFEVSRAA